MSTKHPVNMLQSDQNINHLLQFDQQQDQHQSSEDQLTELEEIDDYMPCISSQPSKFSIKTIKNDIAKIIQNSIKKTKIQLDQYVFQILKKIQSNQTGTIPKNIISETNSIKQNGKSTKGYRPRKNIKGQKNLLNPYTFPTIRPGQNPRFYNQRILATVFVYRGPGQSRIKQQLTINNLAHLIDSNSYKRSLNDFMITLVRYLERESKLQTRQAIQPLYATQINALIPSVGNYKAHFTPEQERILINCLKTVYQMESNTSVTQQQASILLKLLIEQIKIIRSTKNRQYISMSRKTNFDKRDYSLIDQAWTAHFRQQFLNLYIQHGSVARVKQKLSKKFGSNPLLQCKFRLRAKFQQLLRQAIRKIQQSALQKNIDCEYLNDHKIKYIQMANQNVKLRQNILRIFQNQEEFNNFMLLDCVQKLNKLAKSKAKSDC